MSELIRVEVEGSLEFDPAKRELDERIVEILADSPDMDEAEARHEAVRTIVLEDIGGTVLDFDEIKEVR